MVAAAHARGRTQNPVRRGNQASVRNPVAAAVGDVVECDFANVLEGDLSISVLERAAIGLLFIDQLSAAPVNPSQLSRSGGSGTYANGNLSRSNRAGREIASHATFQAVRG